MILFLISYDPSEMNGQSSTDSVFSTIYLAEESVEAMDCVSETP